MDLSVLPIFSPPGNSTDFSTVWMLSIFHSCGRLSA
jgi:hypothetical protein